MGVIFISWRRRIGDDNAVGRLRDRLRGAYGEEAVFRDADSIPGGEVYAGFIPDVLASATVQLVVIGPGWLTADDGAGGRRLDHPDDWVRKEVAQGLARPAPFRLLPVYLGDELTNPFLRRDDLPEPIRGLADIQGLRLREPDFDTDVVKLTKAIGKPSGAPVLTKALLAAAALLFVSAGAAALGRAGDGAPRTGTPAAAPAPTTTTEAPPVPMSGQLNVAVAEFPASDPAGQKEAHRIAVQLADGLETSLQGALFQTVEVRGPDQIQALDGATRSEREASARALAEEIGADVVIDGTVSSGDPSTVAPVMLVRATRLADNPELAGYFDLLEVNAPGTLANPLTESTLIEGLDRATQALSSFVQGVAYYAQLDEQPDNPVAAQQAFTAALGSPELPVALQEATHTFLGSLALFRHDLATARTEFDRAVTLNPSSTRGHLGQAEVRLLQSSGVRCEAGSTGIDGPGLTEAGAAFAAIAPNPTDPEVVQSAIHLKATLGRARALRCRSQAGLSSDFAMATGLLDEVIAGASDDPALRELTFLAHAEKALAVAPEVGSPDAAALDRALDESTLAANDAPGSTRKRRATNQAIYRWQEAFYLAQLGRPAEAEVALRAAAALDPAFATVTVGGLAPQPTGRLVPSGQGMPAVVSVPGSLPFTGGEHLAGLALGLLLVVGGAALRRWSGDLRAGPAADGSAGSPR